MVGAPADGAPGGMTVAAAATAARAVVLPQLRGDAKYLKFKLLQLLALESLAIADDAVPAATALAADCMAVIGDFTVALEEFEVEDIGAGGTTISSSMVHTRSSMGNLKFISFA